MVIVVVFWRRYYWHNNICNNWNDSEEIIPTDLRNINRRENIEEMNILYIAPTINEEISGGVLVRQINYQVLKEYPGNFYAYSVNVRQSRLVKAISTFLSYKNGLNWSHIKNILKIINDRKISVVFCDTSLYGILQKKINRRYPDIRIISFFHNCEYKLYNDCYMHYPSIIRYFLLRSVSINEKYTLNYSSVNIFMPQRDVQLCQEYYGVDKINVIYSPMVLNDKYITSEIDGSYQLHIPEKLLFVGSYFLPNINGLLWFEKNVLPYIDYILIIVGKGFNDEQFLSKLRTKDKIIVRGFVDDITEEYKNADIVIQPVFDGAGMKTKTAECFMFGKTLVSSSEGLVGYDVEGQKNIYRCDSAGEYIDTLRKLKREGVYKFNPEIRKLYLEKYSTESRRKVFFSLLQKMEKQ